MKYKKIAWSVLGIAVVTIFSVAFYQGCSTQPERPIAKDNSRQIDHGTEVYEIEFDGQKYIVVDTFRGIGVCKK